MVVTGAPQVYSFTVQDKDAEALTYGCVAQSLEHAKKLASLAGLRELTLLEVRGPEGVELATIARAKAREDPFIGSEWLPLIDFMGRNLSLFRPERCWIMDIFQHADPLSSEGPYAQALLTPDGSLHVEIGPTPELLELSADNSELAELLGWKKPIDGGMPNFFRFFDPGCSGEYVAATVVQTLSVLFQVSLKDGFCFRHPSGDFAPPPGLERLEPHGFQFYFPVFGIAAHHDLRFPAIDSEAWCNRWRKYKD